MDMVALLRIDVEGADRKIHAGDGKTMRVGEGRSAIDLLTRGKRIPRSNPPAPF
jgi:hypothetical protein